MGFENIMAEVQRFSNNEQYVRKQAVQTLGQLVGKGADPLIITAVIACLRSNESIQALTQMTEKGDQRATEALAGRLEDPAVRW